MFSPHSLLRLPTPLHQVRKQGPETGPKLRPCVAPGHPVCHSCPSLRAQGSVCEALCENIYMDTPFCHTHCGYWETVGALPENVGKAAPPSLAGRCPRLGFFLGCGSLAEGQVHQQDVSLETSQSHSHPTATPKAKARPARTPLIVGHAGVGTVPLYPLTLPVSPLAGFSPFGPPCELRL